MKTVIIDNYDSFTYNLRHLVRELGSETEVLRNDAFTLDELDRYDKIILSPGPGIPQEAGLMPAVIERYAGVKPILGVCLGHQAIGEAFGAKLRNLAEVFHGVQTPVTLLGNDYIFAGLEAEIAVGRYHSWVVDADHPARLSRSHGRQPRRAHHGPAPQELRHTRHTVSPRIGTHTAREKDNCTIP